MLETNGILLGVDPDYARQIARFKKVHTRVSLKAGTPEARSGMKMVMLVYNASLEEEIMTVMKECGAAHYTQAPRVVGVGEKTGPRLDTHVWPGANSVVIVVVEDERARSLMERLGRLRDTLDGGVKAFLLNVEAQV